MATRGSHPDRARRAILAVLPRAAGVGVPGEGQGLTVGGQELRVSWIGEGNLRDVRALLAGRDQMPDVAVARRMSPGARAALADAGIDWVDETGAAEIARGSIIVSRSVPPPKQARRPTRWTPSILGIAEALLCGVRATVAATQGATGLSTGSCTNALQLLTDLGLLAAKAERGRESARRIADRDALLDAYASAAEAQREDVSLQAGVSWSDPLEGLTVLGRKLNREKINWAATGAAAGAVIAPYLTALTSVAVYVDADTPAELEAVVRRAELRPIEGGRLTLSGFPTVTTARMAEDRDGLRTAPWPRVFVDLRRSGVRGEEAAEHLREVMHAG